MTTDTASIRVGVPDDAITNFHHHSVELEESIALPSIMRTLDHKMGDNIYGHLRHVQSVSGFPAPSSSSSPIIDGISKQIQDMGHLLHGGSLSRQRITVNPDGTLAVTNRTLPVMSLSPQTIDADTWKKMTAVLAWFSKQPSWVQVKSTGISHRFVYSLSEKQYLKPVNVYTSPGNEVAVYSFLSRSEGVKYMGHHIPTLVHVYMDQFGPAQSKSPSLRPEQSPYYDAMGSYRSIDPRGIDGWIIPLFNRMYNSLGLFCNSFGEIFLSADILGKQQIYPLKYSDAAHLGIRNLYDIHGFYIDTSSSPLAAYLNRSLPLSPFMDLSTIGYTMTDSTLWIPGPDIDPSVDFEGAVCQKILRQLPTGTLMAASGKTETPFRRSSATEIFHKSLINHLKGGTASGSLGFGAISSEYKSHQRERLGTKDESIPKDVIRFKFQGPGSPLGDAAADLATAIKKIASTKAAGMLEKIELEVPTLTPITEVPVLEVVGKTETMGDIPTPTNKTLYYAGYEHHQVEREVVRSAKYKV